MLRDLAAISSEEQPHVWCYELLNTIGEGSFAKVKLARHILTGIEVAVKVINRHGSYRPFREVHAMKTLNHPNIVKLFEVIDTENTLFLIMELVDGGTLSDYLEDCGDMTEHEARGVFRQLLSAVHYCHQRGIVHRDLKPRNILLDANRNIKLADFGLSNEYVGQKLTTFCGSLNYVAPEILLGQSYDGPGVDVWSLGVILFKMVCGRLPFVADDIWELGRNILRGRYRLPFFISANLADLIGKCLTVQPCHRGTLDELMRHSWTNMGQEEMRPYEEPPCEALNSQVTQEMRNMGFEQETIEEAIREKKYDRTMATYLILSHKAPKGKGRTIIVRPFPDAESSLASSHVSHSVRPSGWEITEPASPPASLDWSAAILAPTPELGTSPPSARPESGTTSPAPRPESGTTRPASRLEAETGTTLTGPECGTTCPVPQPEMGTTSPAPRPELGITSCAPQLEAESSTTLTGPECGTTCPIPQPESGTTSPAPRPELGITSSAPHLEVESGTISAGLESGTTSPALALELGTSSPSAQPGPWGTTSTYSTSGKSGAPERQPEVETPTTSSGQSQGSRGLAKRRLVIRCGNRPEGGRKQLQVGAVQGGHAACEGLGPLGDEVCKLARSSLHRIHIRMVLEISVAFRSTGLLSSEHAWSPLEDKKRGRPHCRSTP
ncbi:serine/threonine-protein kinase MARK2-like [Pteropus medius]|uniref:serine/threonine-protein kinase MARK2-like n=1 Tax=Pteropus vampyrus TaxID=132908 RepID=UPI00196A8677|nr:serine/threonine-protein kinase MARK2-like [Pteropus giganteus]